MKELIKAMLKDEELPNEILIDALRDEDPDWPGDMAKAHVVVGDYGYDEDRVVRCIACYLDKKPAEEHLLKLKNWLKLADRRKEQECPFDHHYKICHNITRPQYTEYYLDEIPLKG